MGSDNTVEDASQDEDSKNVLSLAQAPQVRSKLQHGQDIRQLYLGYRHVSCPTATAPVPQVELL